MCGIAGYIGKSNLDKSVVHKTLGLMNNRGPDYQDYIRFKINDVKVSLLHSRLAILDLDDRSNQPFSFQNCTIIFNGEIYNYIEIRNGLKKLGYNFQTTSDTEVLLKAYIEYGEDCVNYFNGMWSFAIWDDRKNKLFLSRDRFGEKPLYYFKSNDGFYFSSEVKAIQSMLPNPLNINYRQLKKYIVYGYKFLYKDSDTFFENLNEVKYSTNIVINKNLQIYESKYWEPKFNPESMTINQAIEGTRHFLKESMKIRLRSDVPLAFCLSGGVDSASLASIAKKEFNYDVTTFSIIDSDPRYNEYENIKATINDLDCKSYLIDLKYDGMYERLKKLINYHDSPIATISYLVHSMLSQKISEKGFKISISGTSADELFTGYYDHFNLHLYEMRNHKNYKDYLKNWEKYTGRFIRNPYLKNPELYFNDQTIRSHNHLNSEYFNTFLLDDFSLKVNEENFSDSLLRNRMLNELFHEATPVVLHEDDLNSMMYSVENRSPFLDFNLFDFAYKIPNELLINNGFGKFILRESVKNILNDKVRLDRKKKGFNASMNSIFNFSNGSILDLFQDESPLYNLINKKKLMKLLQNPKFDNSYSKFMFNVLNAKIFIESFN